MTSAGSGGGVVVGCIALSVLCAGRTWRLRVANQSN